MIRNWVPFQEGVTYYDAVLADSPVAYWRLGESSGPTANDEVGTSDGTYVSGTFGSAGAVGDGNTAVTFDGTDDHVQLSSGYAVLQVGDTFAVEFWIKRLRASVGTVETIYSADVVNDFRVQFPGSSNRITLRKQAVANVVQATVDITNDGTFHHVVVSKNGATSTNIYIDGVDRTDTVTDQTMVTTATARAIAAGAAPDSYTNAVIDEVAIYDSPLSAARVAVHYAAGT
jgi:hypothetical protein